jgi:hypothetical protein
MNRNAWKSYDSVNNSLDQLEIISTASKEFIFEMSRFSSVISKLI